MDRTVSRTVIRASLCGVDYIFICRRRQRRRVFETALADPKRGSSPSLYGESLHDSSLGIVARGSHRGVHRYQPAVDPCRYGLTQRALRSEPSSGTALMGEQPNPWDLLQPQVAVSRHRGAKLLRRYGLLEEISLFIGLNHRNPVPKFSSGIRLNHQRERRRRTRGSNW